MNKITVQFIPKSGPPVNLLCEKTHTLAEKTQGLMHRLSYPENQGMLFPFRISWYRVFWMKNVKIPLDIIFINKHLQIIAIFETASDIGIFNRRFWAAGFCKYVVESNRGFCKKNRIEKGTTIQIKES